MSSTKTFPLTEEMKQIISDENFLSGLCLADHKIVLLLNWRGGEKVSYAMFHNNEVLFTGTDFKPSPMNGYDSIDTAIDLLGFLTCQPGDTDPGYFANYVPAQLEFAKSYTAEVVKGRISDFEYKDSEYNAEAVAYFESCKIEA